MHVGITECQGVFIITHTQDTLDNLHVETRWWELHDTVDRT